MCWLLLLLTVSGVLVRSQGETLTLLQALIDKIIKSSLLLLLQVAYPLQRHTRTARQQAHLAAQGACLELCIHMRPLEHGVKGISNVLTHRLHVSVLAVSVSRSVWQVVGRCSRMRQQTQHCGKLVGCEPARQQLQGGQALTPAQSVTKLAVAPSCGNMAVKTRPAIQLPLCRLPPR